MSKIIEELKSCSCLMHGSGANIDEILEAEKQLNTKFSSDYKECLIEFNTMAINGHEITGITDNNRIGVVAVTEMEINGNKNVTTEYYVIEKTNIDNIIIWQKSDGGIYQTVGNSELKKIENSLFDYLKQLM